MSQRAGPRRTEFLDSVYPLSMLLMVLAIPLAFLSGSIPFGLLIARAKGINIRDHGSGNIGATNVWRTLGKSPGLACFALDVAKGFVPTFSIGLAQQLLGNPAITATEAWLWLALVAAAILGHMFSPWIGFKGGKGVATGFGALLGIYPLLTWPALGAFATWLLIAKISKYVSLASCIAALSLPAWLALTIEILSDQAGRHTAAAPFYAVLTLLAIVVVAKHRTNLVRLLRGTENRIGQRIDPHATPDSAASETPPDE